MDASVALAAFATVLLAELAGDRTFYAVGSLAARHRPAPVLAGVALAAALKMLAAVLLSGLVARLPAVALSLVTAGIFFAAAARAWTERDDDTPARPPPPTRHVARAAFLTIFCTEWGDPGQLGAAALAGHTRAPGAVWLGATAAMVAKALVATTVGVGMRRVVPGHVLRYVACLTYATMGVLSALRVD